MVRNRLLLVGFAASLFLVGFAIVVPPAPAYACSPTEHALKLCELEETPEVDATSTGSGVDLAAGGGMGNAGANPPVDAEPVPDTTETPLGNDEVLEPAPPEKPTDHFGGQVNQCWNDVNAAECAVEGTGTPPPVAEPIVTWADIVSFKATLPVLSTEPAGWAVRGLPMNPVASASVEVLSGTLLGRPAQVRFTPTAFEWSYGDGATRRSATGGASWSALRLDELSDTSTSHAYAARGEYTLTVSVVLSAEYQFAGSAWRPIAGTLTLAGGSTTISVKTIKTVLVSEDCLRNPRGPGC